jgi:hypothetical protein
VVSVFAGCCGEHGNNRGREVICSSDDRREELAVGRIAGKVDLSYIYK